MSFALKAGRQFALPFIHEATYGTADFMDDDSNADARAWLDAPWPTSRLALWGEAGRGKTHLIHVWARRRGAAILSGASLNRSWALPATTAIAIDDADEAPEKPLLHLINVAAEENRAVLLASRTAPSRWGTRLLDLASRVRAVPAVEIGQPGEAMLAALFASLLSARQVVAPEGVQRWLLLRLPREPSALREAAARIDRASLAEGRRVSYALAAAVLQSLLSD